jgi:hypothetical protein
MLPYLKRRVWDSLRMTAFKVKVVLHKRGRLRDEPVIHAPLWSDSMWLEVLHLVEHNLKQKHGRYYSYIVTSTLLVEVALITGASTKEVAKQIRAMFVDRNFKEPTKLEKPFEEPDTDEHVEVLEKMVKVWCESCGCETCGNHVGVNHMGVNHVEVWKHVTREKTCLPSASRRCKTCTSAS